MIDIYRRYESCSSQNVVLHLMYIHGRNYLVNNIWVVLCLKKTRSIMY